jgi:hypothetical protein
VRFIRFVFGPLLLALGLSLVTGTMSISGQIIPDLDAFGTFREGDVACQEFHTWPALPADEGDYGEYLDAEVASVSASITTPDTDDQLQITVQGAYPSYGVECQVPYNVQATGINTVALVGGVSLSDTTNLTACDEVEVPGTEQRWECLELTIIYRPPVSGECLQPGDFTDTLYFHVEQPAPQLATMEFQLTLVWLQCDPGTPTPTATSVNGTATPTSTPNGDSSGDVTGDRTTFDPAQPQTNEVAGVQDPRAVARVSPAVAGDGGLKDAASDASRVGIGVLLALAGLMLLTATLPLGVASRLRAEAERDEDSR